MASLSKRQRPTGRAAGKPSSVAEPYCTWWNRKTPLAAGKALVSWSDEEKLANMARAGRAYRYGSAYEGFTLTNLSAYGCDLANDHVFDGVEVPVIVNEARALVNSWVNRACANDNPVPQWVTNDGDYEQQLRAANIDEAINAEIALPHGMFGDAHELDRHGVTIAVSATGEYWVFALPGDGKIELELDDGLSIGYVREHRFGRIQTLVRDTWRDPEALKQRYPKSAAAIDANIEHVEPTIVAGEQMAIRARRGLVQHKRRVVRVVQGWRVAFGKPGDAKYTPGRELFVLRDGSKLEDDHDWPWDSPPGDCWQFERELGGEGSTPLTHTIYRMFMRQNEMIHAMDRGEHATAQHLFLCQVGSPEGASLKAQLQGSSCVQVLEVNGDVNKALKHVDNSGLKREAVQLVDRYHQACAYITGIQLNHGTGIAGDNKGESGIHEAYLASYFTERYADQERRLVQFRTVTRARQMWRALSQVMDNRYARWVGDPRKRRQLKASDIDYDEDKYTITTKPASEAKDSPATRLKKAEQWLRDPSVPFTGADMATMSKTLDVDAASEQLDAIGEIVREQCKRWRSSTREEMGQAGWFIPPQKWFQLQGLTSALRIVTVDYNRAMQDRVPRPRLKYFESYMDQCVDLIGQEKRREAELTSGVAKNGTGIQPNGTAVPVTTQPA